VIPKARCKTGVSVDFFLFLKINLTTISMKRARRKFSIDMVNVTDIFKSNQITFFSCFTFIPSTGAGLPEYGMCFDRVDYGEQKYAWFTKRFRTPQN